MATKLQRFDQGFVFWSSMDTDDALLSGLTKDLDGQYIIGVCVSGINVSGVCVG